MIRASILPLATLALLAACGRGQTTTNTTTTITRTVPVPAATPVDVSAVPAATDAGDSAPLPPADATDPGAPDAAQTVVERYYALLDRGDYPAAYRLWADDGRASGKTLAAFTAGFARTASTSVAAGAPATADAGMGQSHVTVPVVVTATLKDGTRQRFAGTYVLGRVNDVDGSTAEQRRWHLRQAQLRPAAAA